MLQSGWFLRAAETRAFESEFAARTNSPYCVLVANGYDALRLTLRACESSILRWMWRCCAPMDGMTLLIA